MQKTVAVLCGGGPAPGINTVIASCAKVFIRNGYRVLGVHNGFKGLLTEPNEIEEITAKQADYLFETGGSYLRMSRFKPADSDFNTNFFDTYKPELLITIGGDDTASTANRLSRFLQSKNYKVSNIHVPKTIDNDLPLPPGVPTFGFRSAVEEGTKIAKTIYNDARTSGNWFIVTAMGREAGHLAFEIGASARYSQIIIPEMFAGKITLQKIARLAISSMLKRTAAGTDFGAVMISEGVFHFIDKEEIANSGARFSTDSHGHPELHSISKSHLFIAIIAKEMAKTALKTRTRAVEIGFSLRTVAPCAFDLKYCSVLGQGVYELFAKGKTGCMVSLSETGNIIPIFVEKISDAKGKVKPRLVDITAPEITMFYTYAAEYTTAADYGLVAHLTQTPEYFDFEKILSE
ncbi:MAG TPA: 6-phosphofructokinase [Bacteroidales bacterium]|nr:6-phosphofructokinase [Bacteroidales bacterium]